MLVHDVILSRLWETRDRERKKWDGMIEGRKTGERINTHDNNDIWVYGKQKKISFPMGK